MTIAIMQPYLFPYLGYWQLINRVDTFVIYDNIQFSSNGWFHRNNILLNGKRHLFTLPLKKDSGLLDVRERFLADNLEKQVQKIIAQIRSEYRKAPYFDLIYPMIEEIFLYKEKNLFLYTYYSIERICKYLNINTKIVRSSEIDIDHSLKSQDKVIAINKKLKATAYINPIGGVELYAQQSFQDENIKLLFLKSKVPSYKQFNREFIPYLSIIDIMMFNSKEDINMMLKKFELGKDFS